MRADGYTPNLVEYETVEIIGDRTDPKLEKNAKEEQVLSRAVHVGTLKLCVAAGEEAKTKVGHLFLHFEQVKQDFHKMEVVHMDGHDSREGDEASRELAVLKLAAEKCADFIG